MSTDASLSNWQLYMNSQLLNSVTGTYYPQAAVRQNANLGLSNWNDPQFAGLLDTFNVYDVALSQSQVGQLYEVATGGNSECYSDQIGYIPPDATFFEVTFPTDPAMTSDPTFEWLPYDPNDSAADQLNHRGIIVLNGTNPVSQYVDLALSSGPAAVTSHPIQSFGGLGTGSIADGSMGWSFELVFKSSAQSVWGKAFDFSNNDGNSGEVGGSWDILMGWYESQQVMEVDLFYDVSEQDAVQYVTSDPFPLDTWTHFVWSIQYEQYESIYSPTLTPLATYSTYVDGQLSSSSFYNSYIDHVIRQHGYLGRSSYNDSAWLGAIDTFRVYSVALNQQQVTTLYAASISGEAGGSSCSSTGSSIPLPPSSSFSSSSSSPSSGVQGDPVFVGFLGQRFNVHGLPHRTYNILSLPQLQLNTRFVPVQHAMNVTQQLSVRQRLGKLVSVLRGVAHDATYAGSDDVLPVQPLPLTTAWSHSGLYMGEAAVQLSGRRLLVCSGAYETGFSLVALDEVQLSVSSDWVLLADGSSIRHNTSSLVEVHTAEVQFQLRNSDHFLNIHNAQLDPAAAQHLEYVDGLLGQTADEKWKADAKSKAWVAHVEEDYVLPEGDEDLWSTDFAYNKYVAASHQ